MGIGDDVAQSYLVLESDTARLPMHSNVQRSGAKPRVLLSLSGGVPGFRSVKSLHFSGGRSATLRAVSDLDGGELRLISEVK